MDIKEELKSAGVYPSGPVSAWPEKRNDELMAYMGAKHTPRAKKVKAGAAKMVSGLARTAGQAIKYGKISEEIREERYNICKACPAFIEDSKRCSECGCFMEAKTWVGGDPNQLCPLKKWSR